MLSFNEWYNSLLLEKIRDLGSVESDIEIEIDLHSSYHADERKFRHETEILDDEIIATFEKGVPQISEALITNKIDVGDIFRIFNKTNNLNVIGVLKVKGNKIPLKFIVVTVMRKKNFIPKKGQKSFFVT